MTGGRGAAGGAGCSWRPRAVRNDPLYPTRPPLVDPLLITYMMRHHQGKRKQAL